MKTFCVEKQGKGEGMEYRQLGRRTRSIEPVSVMIFKSLFLLGIRVSLVKQQVAQYKSIIFNHATVQKIDLYWSHRENFS